MLDLTDEQLDEAALHAAMEETVALARLEGAARRLVALWRDRRMGIVTGDGWVALDGLADALTRLEAMGGEGTRKEARRERPNE